MKKYPIYNPFAYAVIASVDRILNKLLKPCSKAILPPKKILICNGAHLGDVILTTSLLPAIKKAYPNCKIGMLVGSWSVPVVHNHPYVGAIHIMNHWKLGHGYFRTRKQALKELKAASYDAAIDCSFHFPSSSPLLWQAKIPVRVGFESAGLAPFLTHRIPWDASQNIPVAEAFFSLLEPFPQIKEDTYQPCLALEAPKNHHLSDNSHTLSPHLVPQQGHEHCLHPAVNQSAATGERFVQKSGEKSRLDTYLVIHMGSRNEKKQWPLPKWISLTGRLLDRGHILYFTGKGERERIQIEQIRARFPNVNNLCDALSWPMFVATIQNASLLVAIDTSAGHIASATKTPAVLLFTGIHPPNVWRPPHAVAISKEMPCSPCFKGCKAMSCIKEVTVDEVFMRCVQAIEGGTSSRGGEVREEPSLFSHGSPT